MADGAAEEGKHRSGARVVAAGFLMRPLGAIFFDHLGDTIGRKPVMLLSVVMMVLPTILIGIMPTYHDWGIIALISLVVIRLVQGFSVGGEFSGSATFMIEVGVIWPVILIYLMFATLIAAPLGAVPATMVEAFDHGHCLTGYSLSFNIGMGLAGGTAPMVANALIAISG